MATIINGDGIVTAEGTSTTQGRVRLGEDTDNGTNYVELQAPASVASNVTFTLPSADGTNGQVLQTNGSGALSFATPAAGAMTFLSSVTASNSATVDVETTFSSTYDAYMIIVSGMTPATDGTTIWARLKVGGSYDTGSNYRYAQANLASTSSTFSNSVSTSLNYLRINDNTGNGASDVSNIVFWVFNPASTSKIKAVSWNGFSSRVADVPTYGATFFGSGWNTSTSALTGVRFLMSSGNISNGVFRLYGISNS